MSKEQVFDRSKYISGIDPYDKKETLEEAALTLFPGDWSLTERELFKQGAEWQQEQMEKLKDFDTWKEWKNKSE